MGTLYEDSLYFASLKHAGQKRKYTNTEYISHCINVSGILQRFVSATPTAYYFDNSTGSYNDTLCAALLHDVLEDTDATEFELVTKFGSNVATLVSSVTNCPIGYGNRATRNAINIQRLIAATPQAQYIKCADIIDNVKDLKKVVSLDDREFYNLYINEKRMLLTELGKNERIANTPLYAYAHKLVFS